MSDTINPVPDGFLCVVLPMLFGSRPAPPWKSSWFWVMWAIKISPTLSTIFWLLGYCNPLILCWNVLLPSNRSMISIYEVDMDLNY